MRILCLILSIVIGIVGLIYIIQGGTFPAKYDTDSASAVQITQIYSQASHALLLGIGIITIGMLVAVIGILSLISERNAP